MLRVVFDTNVYVSALFGGTPEDIYRAALRGRFTLVVSPAILAELAGVLREKLGLSEADIVAYVRQIGRRASAVKPRSVLGVLTDEPDNRVLECAVEGRADLIVSGDRHLIGLGEFQGIPVVRPVDFLRTLGPEWPS
ncbi:MAG: putative toxin-antitoxin system toxin component, PIN family [Armatimonadetes bacterium]|nr:putative toxin-antitoxin system toxin component, PIN family [Armatimonadota bacterium]